MNDYGKMYLDFDDTYTRYVDNDMKFSDDLYDIMRNLINDYDNVTMDDWFEDEPIVEKKIPEFNFVK